MKHKFVAVAGLACLALSLTNVAYGQCTFQPAANGRTNVCVSYGGNQYSGISFVSKAVGPYLSQYDNSAAIFVVNDDYLNPTPAPPHAPAFTQTTWGTTTYSAAYIGNNFSSISSNLKYGASIGIEGYAEIANLATNMLSVNTSNGSGPVNSGGPTIIDGVNFTGDSVKSVEQALNVAIFFLTSGSESHTNGSGGSYYIGTSQSSADTLTTQEKELVLDVKADFGTSSTAKAGLESAFDDQTWLFTPGTGNTKLEYWALLTLPEGGAAFAYLLMALGACFAAAYAVRHQGGVQKLA